MNIGKLKSLREKLLKAIDDRYSNNFMPVGILESPLTLIAILDAIIDDKEN